MNDKDKWEKLFDPTVKLRDEILENDKKYLESSKVLSYEEYPEFLKGKLYLGEPIFKEQKDG